jgi:hypothetical protein
VLSLVLAAIYFQRFYLKRTIFEYNPKQIAPICLYLAFKVEGEELNYNPDKFLNEFKAWKINERDLIDNEVILMETLDYCLDTKSPVHTIQSVNYRIEDNLVSGGISIRVF